MQQRRARGVDVERHLHSDFMHCGTNARLGRRGGRGEKREVRKREFDLGD